jgi:hypothetical protein
MKTNLNLSIPKPCAERWENFTPTQNGGYCSSCFKTVVDFTKMSDDEIIDFFKHNPKHTCGRFHFGQLKSYGRVEPAKINSGMTLLKAGLMSVLFAIITKPASAQNTEPKSKTETTQHPEKKSEQPDSNNLYQHVTGVVTSSEDGSALPGVSVVLMGSTSGTVSDIDGKFDFPMALKEGDVLTFSFIGLVTRQITITKKMAANFNIPLSMSLCMDMELTGEVEVSGLYERDKGIFARWWSKVKSSF